MAKASLKIHSENILPIIKRWLYSDKDIFLRELVSNAIDAIEKAVYLNQGEQGQFRIDIKIDKENKKLFVSDNGIGMTLEEVETYVSQIAFSGAEQFIEKYSKEKDQFIGHFGLGFYSAFMVSSLVEIETKSYLEGKEAAHWTCDGSSTYDLEVGYRKDRGTDIILHIADDEYLAYPRLKEILKMYCAFLPYPIYLDGESINNQPPLWLKAPSSCTKEDYLSFYKELYPMEPDPIFWIHFQIDHPFHLKAILYFPKISPRFDLHSSNIKLFCNRVFVTNNCKDFFPEYLTVLKGAIDSTDIPLNVSRSYLQKDSTVKKLSSHITKKIGDRLSSLYSEEKESFLAYWPSIETIIKLGVLQDQKFYDRAKAFLVWKTVKNEWLTIEELQARCKNNKVFYISQEEETHFLSLYKEKEIDVIIGGGVLDTAIFNFLEGKTSLQFQRIDGSVDEAILDKDKEKNLLDASGKSEATIIGEKLQSLLSLEQVQVEAKSLANATLPSFIVIEESKRRMRDYLAMTQKEMPHMPISKQTLIVNTNNALIQAIVSIQEKDQNLAKKLITQLYQISLIQQKELHPDQMIPFANQTNELLERLTSLITTQ